MISKNAQKSGFAALATGMLISLVFGFVFGLIVGATEQPWGPSDWPTEEMKGRYVNNKLLHRHQFIISSLTHTHTHLHFHFDYIPIATLSA